jgi:group I intron endonuclease
MFIYKITNQVNGKIYIGQTIKSIKRRFNQHCNSKKSAISGAIQKYGKENFTIEEIDGANSQSELNYKEWLLVYKFNSLSPNGYNLREGGGGKGKASEVSKKRMKSAQKKINEKRGYKNHPKAKKVVNVKTGAIYDCAKECWELNFIECAYSTFKNKLQGKIGNETDFRYLGEESKYKKPTGSGGDQGKKVKCSKSGKIWDSAKEVAIELNIKPTTLRGYLNGDTTNPTTLYYLGEESKSNKRKCKSKKDVKKRKKVLCVNNGKIYNNCTHAAKELGMAQQTVSKICIGRIKQSYGYEFTYVD